MLGRGSMGKGAERRGSNVGGGGQRASDGERMQSSKLIGNHQGKEVKTCK